MAIGLGDAEEVLDQEQALAVLHHAADLAAHGPAVDVLLEHLPQGQDVPLGLLLAEVADEEAFDVIELGLQDAAVGLHHGGAQHNH